MSASDLHEVVLNWPHTDANEVIVTGTFDQWSSSIRLGRTPSGFEAPVRIPWGDKIAYKFIVDGRWTTCDSQASEADQSGFINNVYTAPPKPTPPTVKEPPAVLAPEALQPEPKAAPQEPASELGEVKQNGGVTGAISQIATSLHDNLVAPAVEFASQLESTYEASTPAADEPPSSLVEKAKETAGSVAEKAQEFAAQVAPDAEEVEERTAEVHEPAPSSEPAPEASPLISTEAAALAPTVPVNIVPIVKSETIPDVDVVPGTSVAPSPPAEPQDTVHVFEASTHTPLQPAEATVAVEATEAETDGTSAVVETVVAEPPVVEVVATSPAPELAPPVLAAHDGEPKEVVPAKSTGVVETAAVPAITEVSADVEKVEEKTEAPEVLAAPPVAAEDTKEAIPVENAVAVAVASPEDKTEEPAAVPLPETTPAEPTPAVTNGAAAPPAETNGTIETPVETNDVAAAPAETNGATPNPAETNGAGSAPATDTKAAETTPLPEATSASETKAEEPKSNGSSSPTPANGTVKSKQRRTSSLVASLTSKKERHAFPKEASESGSVDSPSRQGSTRKKRDSIFGKIKHIFHHEKEGTKAK